eukprot:CAMPEP_0170127026 /NCGR_PEP_ID=MMETSP0020_2-20130122/20146_1 /TAXON_ID=98059 /ORGANISM="Dinobryon sp., Strain UTEXLB2267" /LENGTH=92 /DNA_ID=CAMNT_0010360309 /DNA_START=409 /DNA_END=683 /DNA_ORIENTATION=+
MTSSYRYNVTVAMSIGNMTYQPLTNGNSTSYNIESFFNITLNPYYADQPYTNATNFNSTSNFFPYVFNTTIINQENMNMSMYHMHNATNSSS